MDAGGAWMEGDWMEAGWRRKDVAGWRGAGWRRKGLGWRRCLGGGLDGGGGWKEGGWIEGWMEWKCGSVRAVRCRVSVQRFAVFAVHRGERFLAVRFRFAVRFAAF